MILLSEFGKKVITVFIVVVMVLLSACTSAIGFRNPDYIKKIETIAVLDFTGPENFREQAAADLCPVRKGSESGWRLFAAPGA